MGIAEVVVVKMGDDAARGWSCSILVAEAVQEINATVKERKMNLNIVYEGDENNFVGSWSSCSEGCIRRALIGLKCFTKPLSICLSYNLGPIDIRCKSYISKA